MHSLLLIVGLLCCHVVPGSACESRSSPNCIDTCNNTNNAIKISCVNGTISYLDVSADDLDCGTRGGCPGLTSDMIVTKNMCYWKSSCEFRRPERRPSDTIVHASEDKCFGRLAGHLQVNEYRCLPRSQQTNILDMMDCSGQDSKLYLEGGLLRSHPRHPWLFSRHDGKGCSKTIVRKLDMPFLVVTFQDINLGDGDTLQITLNRVGQPKLVQDFSNVKPGNFTKFHWYKVSSITISFEIGTFSNGGRGFVICFLNSANHLTDACKAVTTLGSASEPTFMADSPHTAPISVIFPQLGPHTPRKNPSTDKPNTSRRCKKGKKNCGRNGRKKKRKPCKKNKKGKGKRCKRKGKKSKRRKTAKGKTD